MRKGRQTTNNANLHTVHVAKLEPLRQEHAAQAEAAAKKAAAEKQAALQEKARIMAEGCSDFTFIPNKKGDYRSVETVVAAEAVLNTMSAKGYSVEEIMNNFRAVVQEQNKMAYDAALNLN